MRHFSFIVLFIFSTSSFAESKEPDFADKCSELIEKTTSFSANFTTSLKEATMAGECLGMLHTIMQIKKCDTETNAPSKLASLIVEEKAKTLTDISKALRCTE